MLLDFVERVLICYIRETEFVCAVKGDKHVIWTDDGMGVRRRQKVRWVKWLPGTKEGLAFERGRVVGANRWRALELVLVLSRGTVAKESKCLAGFFLSADLTGGFSETCCGLMVDARLERDFWVRPASVSGF